VDEPVTAAGAATPDGLPAGDGQAAAGEVPAGAPARIEAAGGVVWRAGAQGETQVLLVHRPKYADWTLPKGKCDPDEASEDCALREVEEETGLRCTLGPELAETAYPDRKGRPKYVRYWVMTAIGGEFSPNDEVDEVRWVPVSEVKGLLSYERDHGVVDAFLTGH